MASHHRPTIGDIVDLKTEPAPKVTGAKKNWDSVRKWGPYKLLILEQIDKNTFRVAVCKKSKKDTQLRIKTHSGTLFVVLTDFLIVDRHNIFLCREHQVYGNKRVIVRFIFKARKIFIKSRKDDFFIDLLQSAENTRITREHAERQLVASYSESISTASPDASELFKQIPILNSNDIRCPYCKQSFSGMVNIKYQFDDGGQIHTRFTHARNCKQCSLVILDATQYNEIKRQVKDGTVFTLNPASYKTASELMEATKMEAVPQKSSSSIELLPFEKEIHRSVNLSEHGKKIIVFAQKCHCARCYKKYSRHTIIPRTAKVLSASGQLVDINVMFCAGCGQYYIGYESFKQYKKMYGCLLFECVLSSELQNGKPSFLDFAPDSLLSRWGYNVKKEMPKEHRQAILQFLLETKRITKFEAVEMIKGFIQLKDKQPRFYDACERWREDILFINNYRIKGQDVVYGLTFKQGGKITR